MYYFKYDKESLAVSTIIKPNENFIGNLSTYEVSEILPENTLKNIPGLRKVLIYKNKELMWVYR